MLALNLTPPRVVALILIVLATLTVPPLLKRERIGLSMRSGDAIPLVILSLFFLLAVAALSQGEYK